MSAARQNELWADGVNNGFGATDTTLSEVRDVFPNLPAVGKSVYVEHDFAGYGKIKSKLRVETSGSKWCRWDIVVSAYAGSGVSLRDVVDHRRLSGIL